MFDPADDAAMRDALAACGAHADDGASFLCDPRDWREPVPLKPGVSHELDLLASHQWQRYGAARNAPTAVRVLALWRQRLRRLANAVGERSLLCLLSHAQPANDGLASRYDAAAHAPNPLSTPFPISADAFVTLAASAGLFCAEPPLFTRDAGDVRDRALYAFARRDFSVRFARESDISALERLERLCWIPPLRSTRRGLLARIKRHPEGQFVLERGGEVKGVIYSQRIRDEALIARCTMDDVHTLHDPAGDVVQLLAVNIDPDTQHLACGDQLLEFMLQRSSLQRGVRRIVAVTLCKDYRTGDGLPFEAYVNGPGRERDRVLHFHHVHGAAIAAILPGYRPRDIANETNGVLVAYTPERRRPGAHGVADASDGEGATRQSGDVIDPDVALGFVIETVTALVGNGDAVDPQRPLMESGLDSAGLLTLKSRLEARFGKRLKPSFFFTHNTPRKVVEFYCAATSEAERPAPKHARTVTGPDAAARGQARTGASPEASPPTATATATAALPVASARATGHPGAHDGDPSRDIAIIGIACRLPGGIDHPDALWEALDGERELISDYPASRGAWPRGGVIERGGFVNDIECFDAGFFRISPSEAELTDPQQRLLLEVSWACFEDACLPPETLRGSDTGVFVGASNNDYGHLLQSAGVEVEAHTAVGNSLAVLANRLSYFYDFNGPSLLIDTACSASLVALHSAVQSLRAGECGLALVGGVNLICNPRISQSYAKAGMLSPDGRCKVFDDAADGYVRAEGVVTVLLKPLSEALVDGNRVHAVIRGSAVNHGGQAAGLTVPNPQRQAALLRAAWRDARVSPERISYLEAHGTGTSLGDPIEIEGMQSAFAEALPAGASAHCSVGSVKSNLGHLESAAGLTGLLKVVAAMRHRRLPASLHVRRLNTRMSLADSPLRIQTRTEHWQADAPRIAGVSSFGSGGANGHVVLQEAPTADIAVPAGSALPTDGLFVLSASDAATLRRNVRRLLDWLPHRPGDLAFADAIHTWQSGRTALRHRLAVSVRDFDALADQLERWLADGAGDVQTARVDVTAASPSTRDASEWRDAIVARDTSTLMRLWLQGREGRWTDLYADAAARPRCVGLPGQVFDRTRYWVVPGDMPSTSPMQAATAADAEGQADAIATRCLVPVWAPEPLPEAGPATNEDIETHVLVWTRRALDEARLANGLPGCRVCVLDAAGDDIASRYQTFVIRCFSELRSMIGDRKAGRLRLQVLADDETLGEWLVGLRGMLASASIEEPALAWQLLSVSSDMTLDGLLTLLRMNQRAFVSGAAIRYTRYGRQVRRWNAVPLRDVAPTETALRTGGVYLITGGLGGLGRVFARHLLEIVPDARIIVTGRAEPDARIESQLAEWPEGSRPEYRRLLLDCREKVEAFFAGLREEGVPLRGVLHCAGLVEDGYLLHKTGETFARVFAPKVAGTLYLDEATRDFDLDFFALFSSIMAETGNAGQTDYACANGFMDRYAAHRERLVAQGLRRGRSLAINWPYWRDGGMRIDDSALELLRETRGMTPMPTAIGFDCFHTALRQSASQCLVLHGDLARLQAQVDAPSRAGSDAGSTVAARTGMASVVASSNQPAVDEAALPAAVREAVAALVSEQLKLPPGKLDPEESLTRYGIDSIFINKINLALSRHFDAISKTMFFQFRTVVDVADYLLRQHPEECRAWVAARAGVSMDAAAQIAVQAATTVVAQNGGREGGHFDTGAASGAIAIIGMSGVFPQAHDLDAFWRNLAEGRDCVTEIPPERWDLEQFHEPDPDRAVALGRSYGRHGAFVDDVARFDPMFFGIPPREAANIDPHERLFLQEAWRAMEDAGYSSDSLRRRHNRRVGVFVGVTKTEFELNGAHDPVAGGRWYPRTSFASIANRLSFFLDLAGPSLPIDTMCSSSLVAIHQACEQIRMGVCEAAFAGAVNLYLHPSSYHYLSSLRMLSSDGRCRSFGEGGSGFVPGEGAAVLLLKSLERAIADGDPVHGVILASHVNHGGRTNGFMVPNPRAQAELVRETLDKAGINAREVSYIEAHGTGTALGDPIEIDGLQQAFAPDTSERQFCAIGSAKSNIGHLEAAAGIAGLIKVLLQMRHRQLAPSLHAERTNPNIRFNTTPFTLNRSLRSWDAPTLDGRPLPRIAGVSSFGAGGVNAHVLLREHLPPAPVSKVEARSGPWLVPLSAMRREELVERARQLRDALDDISVDRARALDEIAHTLQVGRDAMAQRVAFVVDSMPALRAALDDFIHGRFDNGSVIGSRDEDRDGDPDASGDARERRARAVEACFAWGDRIDLPRLARLWTEGATVDWTRLHRDRASSQRLHLPTYPFAGDIYWHERLPTASSTLALPATTQSSAPGMHNLAGDTAAADDILFAAPAWRPLDTRIQVSAVAPVFDRHLVLLCDTGVDAAALATALRRPGVDPQTIDCIALKSEAHDPAEHYADVARQCFEHLRALALDPDSGRILVQCVILDEGDGQLLRGLSALLRTLSMEHSRLGGQVVGIVLGTDPAALAARLRALVAQPQARLVRWRGERAESLDWERLSFAGETPPVFREDGVYVITGGLGALGRLFAAEILARCPRATVVLTGRAPLTDAITRQLDALAGSHPGLVYRSLDLLDGAAVSALFEDLRERHGTVHGILHCAGMIADSLIVRKAPQAFASTLQPKVTGTWHLDRASRTLDLDFFVVFSSIASAMGSIGQADYATANGFMDHFVQRRRERVRRGERKGASIAIHWPYWREGGMRIDSATAEVIAQSIGMRPMDTAVGLTTFRRAIALDLPRVLVAQGDPERFLACLRGVESRGGAAASPSTHPQQVTSLTGGVPAPAGAGPQGSAAAGGLPLDRVQAILRDMLAEVLQARPDDIAPRKPLVELGLDSVLGTEFIGAINRRFSTTLSTVGIYDHPSLHALAQHVAATQPLSVQPSSAQSAPTPALSAPPTIAGRPAIVVHEPAARYGEIEASSSRALRPFSMPGTSEANDDRIAVVGMSGRYPQAKNLDAYWRNLVAGLNAVVEIPDSRWDVGAYYDPDPEAEGRMYCKWMGVLDDADAFDPRFFRITPQEALYMDPEQRLFLQESYRALEDAGYAGDIVDGLNCGVYLGMESSEYGWHFAASPRVSETITGNHSAIAAARLAYFLNLKGPALAVDTACSSSLVAVHLACQALRGGEIDMALAGGVRLWLSPVTHVGMSKARMLSPTGQCRTFDDAADGIVMGEGVGAVVLKRLADAERDGDAILGVILASGINQDGRTNGITAPSVKSQIALERRVYRDHGIDPETIGYIEAHGTGTRLGDPIELQALSTVFREHTTRERFCALGSVKTNIGHTAAASGVASLHKVLLSLRHRQLVPSLNIEHENRHFDFARSPFYVNRNLAPWTPGAAGTRRACVSSFGFSGTNAHLVIEEYVAPIAGDRLVDSPAEHLILLSARTTAQLEQRARDLLDFLDNVAVGDGSIDVAGMLHAIAQTLQVGRAAMEERAAFIADSLDTLKAGLRVLCGESGGDTGVHPGVQRGRTADDDATLALWNSDDDLRATLGKWLQARQLSKIAGLWLKGVEIDWRALHGNARITRLHLPTYPFAEERYWIDRRTQDVDAEPGNRRRPATGDGALHPLVHANVSDLGRQAYRTVLSPDAFLLDGHRVHGTRVLPGVACLEMARAAVCLALPEAADGHLEIVDHTWIRPVIVEADTAVTLVLLDEGEDDDGVRRIDYEILGEAAAVDAEPLLHARGTVYRHPSVPELESISPEALAEAIGGEEDGADALYRHFDALGLHYGAGMRGIVGLWTDGRELLARLRLPETVAADADAYGLHPAVMDAAMQCTIRLLAGFDSGQATAAMPFSIDGLQIHADTTAAMWAWVRPAEEDGDGATAKLDIDLLDEAGTCCVQVFGLTSRAAPRTSPVAQLRALPAPGADVRAAPARPSLRALLPIWNPVSFAADLPPTPLPQGEDCLLLGGDPADADWLGRALTGLQRFEPAPDASIETIAAALAERRFRHLLWMAPEVTAEDDIVAAQETGVLALFRIVKALTLLDRHEQALDVTVVTRRAMQVFDDEPILPHHAGVHGMVGSIAKEMPTWRVRLVDIATTAGLDPAALLSLPWDAKGDGLACRGDTWYRREFADIVRLPQTDLVCRQNGTYLVIGGAGGLGEVWTRHMVTHYDANVIWIGRRPEDAEITARLDAIAELGRRPRYVSVDAADPVALADAVARIRETFPRIDGVVHSALVLQDQSVRAMDEGVFRRSLAAKVDISVNLAHVFGDRDLDFMLFFSSLSSFYRGAGQSNYCAGCTFKDSFADALRARRSWPVKIVNWGYWGSVGIVTDAFYRKRMENLGFGSIEPAEAMRALEVFLASDMQQLVLVDVIAERALDDIIVSEEIRHYPDLVTVSTADQEVGVAS